MYTKNRDILLELLQDMEDFARMKNEKCPPIYLLGVDIPKKILKTSKS